MVRCMMMLLYLAGCKSIKFNFLKGFVRVRLPIPASVARLRNVCVVLLFSKQKYLMTELFPAEREAEGERVKLRLLPLA